MTKMSTHEAKAYLSGLLGGRRTRRRGVAGEDGALLVSAVTCPPEEGLPIVSSDRRLSAYGVAVIW